MDYFQKLLDWCDSVGFHEISSPKIEYQICLDILKYLKSIYNNALKKIQINVTDAATPNPHYSKKFSLDLIEISVECVLWTKLMTRKREDYAVLEKFDNYINNFKQNFKGKPSVDDYLLGLINFNTNILRSEKKNENNFQKELKIVNDDMAFLYYQENWKGKVLVENQNFCEEEFSDDEDSETSVDDQENCLDEDFQFSEYDDAQDDINLIIKKSIFSNKLSNELKLNDQQNLNFDTNNGCLKEDCPNLAPDLAPPEDKHVFNLNNKSSSECQSSFNDSTVCNLDKDKVDNKSELATKRGTLLRPCVDFNIRNQKPSRKSIKRKLIKNYNNLIAKKIKKVKIYVKTRV